MTADDSKGARRPLSYGEPSDREPCEGRQASPSNPTKNARRSPKGELNAVVVFRCTASEKQALSPAAPEAGSTPSLPTSFETDWSEALKRAQATIETDIRSFTDANRQHLNAALATTEADVNRLRSMVQPFFLTMGAVALQSGTAQFEALEKRSTDMVENRQVALEGSLKSLIASQATFMNAWLASGNLFEGRADLFMVVPLDQVDAQAVFLRLLTNIILGMAVRLEGARKPKKNVLLVLDEFVRLGRMEKLINIANVAAGCGIEALFITQDKGQIESVYGKGDTASILGSCVTTRIFGLGRAEFETANWAANALGDQTVLTHTKQSAAKFGESRKTSTAEQRQKLMTADQLLEMKTGKMLLLTGSKPPALVDAIVSHRHPAYRGKLDRNPMV